MTLVSKTFLRTFILAIIAHNAQQLRAQNIQDFKNTLKEKLFTAPDAQKEISPNISKIEIKEENLKIKLNIKAFAPQNCYPIKDIQYTMTQKSPAMAEYKVVPMLRGIDIKRKCKNKFSAVEWAESIELPKGDLTSHIQFKVLGYKGWALKELKLQPALGPSQAPKLTTKITQ